jgi:anti-sigma factor RsiW
MNEMDDDARLLGYADGQLDGAAARALEARLAVDPGLRDRLALIRKGALPFASAFDALLATAPVARLDLSLSELLAAQRVSAMARKSSSPSWTQATRLAAAIALLFIGIGLGRLAPTWPTSSPDRTASSDRPREDWRAAVAEYASLYTEDTFAAQPRDVATEAADLARLGAKVGVDLTPDRIAIADGQFRGTQILSYDGAPLGQIAYVDPNGHPILFCIFANDQPDAAMKRESRGDYSLASWERGGRGYMVIARAPQDQLAELANALMRKF